jgi:hypothetical protein
MDQYQLPKRHVPALFFSAIAAVLTTLTGCGGGTDGAAYTPPIEVSESNIPDQLALRDLAETSSISAENRTVCSLFRAVVNGDGPAGAANFDPMDPTAVQREFQSEYAILQQVYELDTPVKAEIQLFIDTMAKQIGILEGNGWVLLDPQVLATYQAPEYKVAVGKVSVWGASECGVVAPEQGLEAKVMAILTGGAAAPATP